MPLTSDWACTNVSQVRYQICRLRAHKNLGPLSFILLRRLARAVFFYFTITAKLPPQRLNSATFGIQISCPKLMFECFP